MNNPAGDGLGAAKVLVQDGMRIHFDVPVEMDDGLVLKADLFLPIAEGRYPVILSHGPYAKGLAFQDGYSSAWNIMVRDHPDVPAGSTNKYQSWEVVDPGEVGAGRLRVRPGRSARSWPLTRLP